jgi:hypothetical protein
VLIRSKSFWGSLIVLALWLTLVIFLATHHEFRRDEVRALSLARAAHWPWELFALTRYDGHPILWYVALYLGLCISSSALVLPIISIAIAFAAVIIVLRYSAFPFWFKGLFIFSGLPLYEYAVTARNYGISMLLIVVAAALYKHRIKQGWWLALALALLANTNVHSALLVCIIAAMWARTNLTSWRLRIVAQFAIIIAGVVLCTLTTWPTDNTILTSAHRTFRPDELALSALTAAFRPDLTFKHLAPEQLSPIVTGVLLTFAVIGLMKRPVLFLAALAAQILLGVLFLVVYSGSYRHEGLFAIFLLFLYWQWIDSPDDKGRWFNFGFYAGLLPLIILNVVLGGQYAWDDVQHELSSNRAFGQLIQRNAAYQDAIIMAEPDYAVESLPYYTDNALYLLREGRFNKTVSWTTASADRMSLGQLLAAAQKIQAQEQRPILIALGHLDIGDVEKQKAGEKRYSYNKTFTWSAEDWAAFDAATERVAILDLATSDEIFEVYILQSAPLLTQVSNQK